MTPPPANLTAEPLAAVEMGVDALPAGRIRRDLGQIVRFIRFTIVGGLASIVYLSLFAALLAVGVHYLVAGTIGYLSAIATNFAVNREWTFGRGTRAIQQQAAAFLGVQLTIGAMNLTLLHGLVVWGIHPIIVAQLLTCAALFPLNFLASQRWGFR
jgi:putative flippase GtrA